MALLEVEKLAVHMPTLRGEIPLVREVNFSIERGETLGIVGESGCGKTMTALALMGLLPDGAIPSGAIRFEGENLLALPARIEQHRQQLGLQGLLADYRFDVLVDRINAPDTDERDGDDQDQQRAETRRQCLPRA